MENNVVIEKNPIGGGIVRKVYVCEECGYSSTRRWNLKMHIAGVHKAEWTKFTSTAAGATGTPVYEEVNV